MSDGVISAVNLNGIWPRRAPKARAVHAAGGLGIWGPFFGGGDLAEAAASAASMQFTALVTVPWVCPEGVTVETLTGLKEPRHLHTALGNLCQPHQHVGVLAGAETVGYGRTRTASIA